MNKGIAVLALLSFAPTCYAENIDLVRIICPEGADFLDAEIISIPTDIGEKEKLTKFGYYHKGKTGKIESQCTIAGKPVTVSILYSTAHTGRCGGNPGANITLTMDGFSLIRNQPLRNKCEGIGIKSFLLNQYDLEFCISGISNQDTRCSETSIFSIKNNKSEVSVKKLAGQ